MAVISSFFEIRDRNGKPHPTTVECGYFMFNDRQQGTILQLESGGSNERESPGKVSQTFQLTEAAARDLVRILTRSFPNLRSWGSAATVRTYIQICPPTPLPDQVAQPAR